MITKRRNHCACIISDRMYVYGGLNAKGDYLNDVWEFYFKKRCWYKNRVILDGLEDNQGIAYHACVAVYEKYKVYNKTGSKYEDLSNYTFLNQQSNLKKSEYVKLFKYQGIFCFGGKKEDGSCTNELKVLDISGKTTWLWQKVRANGKPPAPRFYHTMNMYANSRILIIHGGRDNNFNYFSDLCAFDLVQLEWIHVIGYTKKVIPRCGHSSAIVGSRLIVFGGMNPTGFVKGKVQNIQLNHAKIPIAL